MFWKEGFLFTGEARSLTTHVNRAVESLVQMSFDNHL